MIKSHRLKTTIRFAILLLFYSLIGQPLVAQENKELNFLLGEWTLKVKIKNAPETYIHGKGTMSVKWNAKKDTLLAEMKTQFKNFSSNGTTKRSYDKQKQKWTISWNPTIQGRKVFKNIEGQFNGSNFIEIDYGQDQNGNFIGRLVIYNITRDHFLVRKDNLYDNGALAEEIWVYEATRN